MLVKVLWYSMTFVSAGLFWVLGWVFLRWGRALGARLGEAGRGRSSNDIIV
jgi:hypothetical protein